MDRAAVKESRQILRRIQQHLYETHTNLGATCESVGMVDVLYHPSTSLGSLNYVTPRKNTAWVSAEMVQEGLEYMRDHDRLPRVNYIEGLFPPLFAKVMRDLGLRAEWELPLMVYVKYGFNNQPTAPVEIPELPEGIVVAPVTDQRGIHLWWYVWRNAHYEVSTLGVEPLFVGQDMAALKMGHQVDVLLYRYGFPVGVSRVSIQGEVGHIVAQALMTEAYSDTLARILQAAAVKAALEKGCALVYAPGETEAERQMSRAMGFLDFGSMVCFAATPSGSNEDDDDDLGQPVLALR